MRKGFFFVRNPERKRPVGGLDLCGCIILEWILEKYDGVVWTGSIWLRIATSGGLL
jgi:hypothetical protein